MFKFKYFVVVASTILGTSCQFYSFGILNALDNQLLPWIQQTYADRFGWESGSLKLKLFWSASISFFALGAIPGVYFADSMATRFGPRTNLIVNGIAALIAYFLQLCVEVFGFPELLLISRLLLGFTMTLGFGLMASYLADITPPKTRPQLDRAIQVQSDPN
jgi:MFS family permease